MKLIISVPNFPAPDSFTDNVVHTLKAMGHEVRAKRSLTSATKARYYILSSVCMGQQSS